MNKTKWTWWLFLVAVFSLSALKAIAGEGEISSFDYSPSAIHCDQMTESSTSADYSSSSEGGYSAGVAAQ